MKKLLYSIKDNKAEHAVSPHCFRSEAECLRELSAAINGRHDRGASFMETHPEDFTLYFIGTFDDHTCAIDAQPPKVVLNLIDLKEPTSHAEHSEPGKDW